ncbi:MAG: hypothetical protein HC918_10130 [Oscillatoriales cyanobacterium SM2_1_8]|nr:hypothetical protein [Oscillatoriales cyanobacterium SM2_1_8]
MSGSNVFNYVLQVAGLQAKRDGKTVIIGRNLPITARETVLRTVRLNQLKVNLPNTEVTMTANVDASLASGGTGGGTANSRIARTQSLSQRFPMKGALQLLEELGANGGTQAQANRPGAARGVGEGDLLLGGLQASADVRTNTLTLIGTPNLVDLAETYLRQLDVRRRQVAVNVRIVEVALDKNENIGTSFSFGVGDSFFNVNQGEATANFGTVNPRFLPRPSDPNPNPGSFVQPRCCAKSPESGWFGRHYPTVFLPGAVFAEPPSADCGRPGQNSHRSNVDCAGGQRFPSEPDHPSVCRISHHQPAGAGQHRDHRFRYPRPD